MTPAETKAATNLINQLLKEGYYPPGAQPPKGQNAAIGEAADRLGINRKTLVSAVSAGRIKPTWKLFRQPARQSKPPAYRRAATR